MEFLFTGENKSAEFFFQMSTTESVEMESLFS
jgi:hypothetical protein